MSNLLTWSAQSTGSATHYLSVVDCTNDDELKASVEACALKAIQLIESHITDDSLYLMFEWNKEDCTLHAVLTDATKSQDAPNSVTLKLNALSNLKNELTGDEQDNFMEEKVEKILFWLHDYFSTSAEFFRYSLVSIFHSSTRNNTRLL